MLLPELIPKWNGLWLKFTILDVLRHDLDNNSIHASYIHSLYIRHV